MNGFFERAVAPDVCAEVPAHGLSSGATKTNHLRNYDDLEKSQIAQIQ